MPSVLAARSLLEQAGPLDEDLVMNYDGDLWLRFAELSELDGIDEPLTLVRRHGLHGASDTIAWGDLRRVVEKALRATRDARFAALLREQRAVTSVALRGARPCTARASGLCAPSRRARRTRGPTCDGGATGRTRWRGRLHRGPCARPWVHCVAACGRAGSALTSSSARHDASLAAEAGEGPRCRAQAGYPVISAFGVSTPWESGVSRK
jgi:hypothetical protein